MYYVKYLSDNGEPLVSFFDTQKSAKIFAAKIFAIPAVCYGYHKLENGSIFALNGFIQL